MATHQFAYADTLYKVPIDTPDGVVDAVAASYGGVSFFVESGSSNGGRNVVTNPIPFSENHVNEDTGRIIPEYSFNIYIVGDDAEAKREALEEVFNKEGAFELSHPNYGTFMVRCKSYSLSFSNSETSYISGSVTFVPEVLPKSAGRSKVDLRGQTISAADEVLEKSSADFEASFDLTSVAKDVVDAVRDFTVGVLDSIESARQGLRNVSAFVNEISGTRENLSLILMTPADFTNRIRNILARANGIGGLAEIREYSSFVNKLLQESPSSPAADELKAIMRKMMLMVTLSNMAKSVVDGSYESSEEARLAENLVDETFTAALESVESVDDYQDLLAMQAVALKTLRENIVNLATIIDMPLKGRRDALSLCFDIYGNLDKLDDILARNTISDPMAINRTSIKVLSK